MSSFYDDASLVVIPSGYKTSKVYAEKPTDGSGDLTFTRTGDTATRVNSAGLIEKVRTNLALQSETFNNASWAKNACSITANATTAPNGTTTADKIVEDNSGAIHRITQSFSGQGFTFSFYAKSAERTKVAVISAAADIGYDLTSGTVIDIGYGVSGASMQSIGNGWWRCSLVNNDFNPTYGIALLDASNQITYTGNGTSGAFIWGAQAETGDIATDYIPTTTAAVSVGPVANVPRLDYLGSTCPRLLLEPQRTNLYPYSEQLNQWTASGSTVTANYATSPDGYTNADRVQFSSATDMVYYSGTGSAGENTLSVYAKATNGTSAKFRFFANGATTYSSDQTATGEWQRFTFTYTYSAQTAGLRGATTGASDVIFYGFQHEIAAYATSYIGPTLGAAVTRGADACYKTGISSLIGQTEGTLFCEISGESLEESSRYMSIGVNGDSTNRLVVYQSNNLINVYCGVGATFNLTYNPPAGPLKIAVAYKSGDYAFYVNGVQAAVSAISGVPLCSEFNLGRNEITAAELPPSVGYSQAILFKTRLTNAQLAELTTL